MTAGQDADATTEPHENDGAVDGRVDRRIDDKIEFVPTGLDGVFVVEPKPMRDERGFFARTFCTTEFERAGLDPTVAQSSISFTQRAGSIRGMHLRDARAPEYKLVRCTAGGIFDVVVDLRPDSPTFGTHVAVQLTARNRKAITIPALCAHGFQTLEDDTEVLYQMNRPHVPGHDHGLRFDDPVLGIVWPRSLGTINDKDRSWTVHGDLDSLRRFAGENLW